MLLRIIPVWSTTGFALPNDLCRKAAVEQCAGWGQDFVLLNMIQRRNFVAPCVALNNIADLC
jgi:hypothetical protein